MYAGTSHAGIYRMEMCGFYCLYVTGNPAGSRYVGGWYRLL